MIIDSESDTDTKEQHGQRYILGIDIGTTSVKVAVIDVDTLKLVEQRARTDTDTDSTNANANSSFSSYYHVNNNTRSEQYVASLVESLNNCILSLSGNMREKIIGIGVCGQMHGVVCWSSHHRPWTKRHNDINHDANYYDINSSRVSHHITWQDNRCDSQFISSLPRPDSHLTIHTGYGCCTLFWLARNSPSTIENYNRAGTIADFIVTMLCDEDRVQMSDQNAASWGYFNTQKREWNMNILNETNFPVRFLPDIVEPTKIAGHLKSSWHRIREGTPVGVALGDLQSYIYAVLSDNGNCSNNIDTNKRTAVINISTSAQLVFEMQNFVPADQDKTNAKIVPYFNGKYLHEAAALNGGNALSVYVTFLQQCLHTFGFELDTEKIWELLIKKSIQTNEHEHESDLSFEPVFLGERYNPELRANICNITPDNFHAIHIFKALCRGLMENISKITSMQILKQNGIEMIVATGSALLRNPVLQKELITLFPLTVEYRQSASSPYGVAKCMAQILKHFSD